MKKRRTNERRGEEEWKNIKSNMKRKKVKNNTERKKIVRKQERWVEKNLHFVCVFVCASVFVRQE